MLSEFDMSLQSALGTSLSPRAIAQALASHGRNGDTVLAHINPREAAMLRARGGSGTINPITGLPEFFGDDGDFSYTPDPGNYVDQSSQNSSAPSGPGYTPQQPIDYSAPSADSGSSDMMVGPGLSSKSSGSGLSYDPSSDSNSTVGLQPSAPSSGASGGDGGFMAGLGFAGPGGSAAIPATSPGISSPTAPGATPGAASPLGGSANDQKSFLDTLSAKADQYPGLVKALGVGGLGLLNNTMANKTRKAGSQEANQLNALGSPLQAQGNQMIAAGQSGQLTPVQQQQLSAMRAKVQQDLMRSGASAGTASLQAEQVIQQQAQQFAQDLIQQGMQLVQAGNSYATQAITAGYKANQEAQTTAADFYASLAKMVMGTGGGSAKPTP